MTSTPPLSDTPAPATPARKRGPFAFLFKSALGCTAFGLGCLAVLVLLLPTLLGGVAAKLARQSFDETFHGSITIDGAKLAWFGEQRVDGIVLHDPEHKQVGRASIVLPSLARLLRSGRTDIGRVTLDVDADLVQDDTGVTNLQRALEPRAKQAGTGATRSEASAFDPIDWLARLDLELEVRSTRLTWSDAETRRAATPFEVHDFGARVTAHPGAAIVVHAGGRIVAEEPGALGIDAQIMGPISARSVWPFGRVDAEVRIEGFSTAMVDGIAGLHGQLKEVLGERFTLNARVTGATRESGDVDVTLAGGGTSLSLEGRFEAGALRSNERSGLTAILVPPRGLLKAWLDRQLPAGAKVDIDPSGIPWRISAARFDLPVPPAGARDFKGLLPALERAALDLEVQIPRSFESRGDPQGGSSGFALGSVRIQAHVAPNQPWNARLDAEFDAGGRGQLAADITLFDAWTRLAQDSLPIVDVHVHASDFPTDAIAAVIGQSERLQSALGSSLGVDFDARDVSLDGGTILVAIDGRNGSTAHMGFAAGARVAEGLAHFDRVDLWVADANQWIEHEIAAFLPVGTGIEIVGNRKAVTIGVSDLSLPMPSAKVGDFKEQLRAQSAGTIQVAVSGAKYSDATLRAANTSVDLMGIDLQAKLEPGGVLALALRGVLAQGGERGKVAVDASTASAWEFVDGTPPAHWPPIEAHALLEAVPTSLADAFVQHDGFVGRVLGDRVGLVLDAHGASARGGSLSARLDAPRATATLAGTFAGGTFQASGAEGLAVSARIPAAVLRSELAGALPADFALTWPDQVADLKLRANDIAFAVPDRIGGQRVDVASALETLAAHVRLELAGVGLETAATKVRELDCGARDVVLDATIAPRTPLALKLGANLTPGDAARLVLDATLADPFALARGEPLRPVDAKVGLAGLDTRVLDALAGQDGLIASLLGPSLRVSIDARGASTSGGTFVVDASNPAAKLHAAARVDAAGLHCAGEEGLDLSIAPDPAGFDRCVKRFMPAGARLELAPEAGAFVMKLRDVDVTLSQSASSAGAVREPLLERLSKLASRLDATLPAFVYSDAATDAARRPVTLRDVRIAADFAPGRPPSASVSAAILDEPPGAISAGVRALDPLAQLADANGLDTFRVNVDVHASNVPTAIVDMLAGQGGALVEALGARVELGLSAPAISRTSGAFSLDVRFDLHGVNGRGHVEGGTIVVDEVDGLVATVGLGPVMSRRVVGKLLPTLVDVEKPAGAAPAKFSVDALRFPLNGDLRKLDGIVRIDLGEVNYALFPKLAAFLGESSALKAARIPTLAVPIQKGVAGYQKLPVVIGGREYEFSGTYDIAADAAQLTAHVPLKLLGKKVSSELERLREFLDPDLTLPLTIRGSLVNPSVALDGAALEKALEDAAGKALGKAGGGLLDGLLKKKKKD